MHRSRAIETRTGRRQAPPARGRTGHPAREHLPASPAVGTDRDARRHGEFKQPGGKLVVVDFDDDHGTIRRFRLSGDFFLEPDSLQETIDSAIEGLPTAASAEALHTRIEAALPAEAQLIGVSVAGIVTASRAHRPRPGAHRGGGARRSAADAADLELDRAGGGVIPLAFSEQQKWSYAAIASFIAGVMPPSAMLGRSWWKVSNRRLRPGHQDAALTTPRHHH